MQLVSSLMALLLRYHSLAKEKGEEITLGHIFWVVAYLLYAPVVIHLLGSCWQHAQSLCLLEVLQLVTYGGECRCRPFIPIANCMKWQNRTGSGAKLIIPLRSFAITRMTASTVSKEPKLSQFLGFWTLYLTPNVIACKVFFHSSLLSKLNSLKLSYTS